MARLRWVSDVVVHVAPNGRRTRVPLPRLAPTMLPMTTWDIGRIGTDYAVGIMEASPTDLAVLADRAKAVGCQWVVLTDPSHILSAAERDVLSRWAETVPGDTEAAVFDRLLKGLARTRTEVGQLEEDADTKIVRQPLRREANADMGGA